MDYQEKICIYVPKTMANALDRDARLFEVFRTDGRTINRNKFLNRVLLGYYGTFVEERTSLTSTVAAELDGVLRDLRTKNEVAKRIVRAITSPIPANKRLRETMRISLKPTKETYGLVQMILADTGGDALSRFFYGMLASYSSKESSNREAIVYKETADLLRTACNMREMVTFVYTWNRGIVHKVVPYKLVAGQDGQLNYLLCYEPDNPTNPEWKALPYRLARIDRPQRTGEKGVIPKDVESHLSMMTQLGPQFSINDDTETCVRLTEKGVNTYQRIYQGRPVYDRQEMEGDEYLYHFRCSQDQLFLYFRRFGSDEAEVITPESLRNRIIDFHVGALKTYGMT